MLTEQNVLIQKLNLALKGKLNVNLATKLQF